MTCNISMFFLDPPCVEVNARAVYDWLIELIAWMRLHDIVCQVSEKQYYSVNCFHSIRIEHSKPTHCPGLPTSFARPAVPAETCSMIQASNTQSAQALSLFSLFPSASTISRQIPTFSQVDGRHAFGPHPLQQRRGRHGQAANKQHKLVSCVCVEPLPSHGGMVRNLR